MLTKGLVLILGLLSQVLSLLSQEPEPQYVAFTYKNFLSYLNQFYYPSPVTAQDVAFLNCGAVGYIVNATAIVETTIGWIFDLNADAVLFILDCDVYGDERCIGATVESPVGTTRIDVDICVNPGKISVRNNNCTIP